MDYFSSSIKKEVSLTEPERISLDGAIWKKSIAATGQIYYL
jgi:hypothetical protein